ncbi:hypothetical protein [Paenibacillus sp. UASWS1643]|uniref:hypothetical protein n=1 Tax=Paenibacillus sp. UASWS1643 TaxID=2580422 RepID=UPI0012384A38|nr:hypothetical protein [Paenibacillus sp. UASWS1643]KAA8747224.1 hypothetical protein FE296_23905 [Paenibacillus sp. UASWS1643]
MSNIKAREQQKGIVTTRSGVFNEKKNELKSFSESLPKEAELPSVPTSGGLFGLFPYNVKGDDLNRLTESIQNRMIEQNKVLVRTIKEFNTIYDTFSALDKEYIQGIIISLKAAEEANAKALKGIEGVQDNQDEIKQIINQQKQVIQVLKNFKEKIEKIEHLADVDQIFAGFSKMHSNVNVIETKVEAQINGIKTLASSLSVFQDNLKRMEDIQNKQFQAVNQRVKDDIQSLAEKIDRDHSEFDAKLDATTNEVTIYKSNFEYAIKELNVGIEQQAVTMSAYLESELSRAKSEITELSLLTGNLSKALNTTRVISFASIAITFALVIMIVVGVL